MEKFFLPVGMLVGTIVGAGVFALPYVFQRSGFGIGLVYLFLSAVVYIYVYLLYSDIILRTKKEHRLVGYAHFYLGRFWAILATISTVLGILFSMAVFLVLSVSFFEVIYPSLGNALGAFIFWVIGTFLIFSPLKNIERLEFLITLGIIAIIFTLFFVGAPNLSISSFSFIGDAQYLFSPLGVIFFALAGGAAVPSIIRHFRSLKLKSYVPSIRRVLIVGTVIPAVLYILFVLGVFGLSGEITPDAITGLLNRASDTLIILVGMLGLLALWSTYILIGLNVEDTLKLDFSFARATRFMVVALFPIAIFFIASESFIELVSFTGGIFLALEGFFILAIWHKLNTASRIAPIMVGKGHYVLFFLTLFLFSIAFIYEITHL